MLFLSVCPYSCVLLFIGCIVTGKLCGVNEMLRSGCKAQLPCTNKTL